MVYSTVHHCIVMTEDEAWKISQDRAIVLLQYPGYQLLAAHNLLPFSKTAGGNGKMFEATLDLINLHKQGYGHGEWRC